MKSKELYNKLYDLRGEAIKGIQKELNKRKVHNFTLPEEYNITDTGFFSDPEGQIPIIAIDKDGAFEELEHVGDDGYRFQFWDMNIVDLIGILQILEE